VVPLEIKKSTIFVVESKNIRIMATMVREKSRMSTTGMMRERIFVDVPQSDMIFFKLFIDKMGWPAGNRQALWEEYMRSSPKNVDLSEEEIMEEVRAVRYGKAQDHC